MDIKERGKVRVARDGHYRYSPEIPGYKRNHNQSATFDVIGYCVGITQGDERVLLSPEQYRQLVNFVERGRVLLKVRRRSREGDS